MHFDNQLILWMHFDNQLILWPTTPQAVLILWPTAPQAAKPLNCFLVREIIFLQREEKVQRVRARRHTHKYKKKDFNTHKV